ncbi:MAG: ADP-ribosylglycohydrolase family protein [Sulfurimonas sp.]|nr:ADP-ribosylglycohydrolase family protein [Sulfurimonas sp.]
MDAARIKNALWGAFIADSIAMPVHWYYQRKYIKEGFEGGIQGYEDAPHPHPESFMVGNSYRPNIAKANELGRPFDIAHEHVRFYNTNYNDFDFKLSVHDGEHKNAMPSKDERYHYHHGLKAGENTLGANLIRVLMRSVIKEGGYKQEAFIEDFVSYLTTPGLNRDPYTEVYIRAWFENFSNGVPPHACAEQQRNIWSIGSSGGIIRPLILALTSKSSYQALGVALQHQQITHRSDNVSSALSVLVPLLHKLVCKEEPLSSLKEYSKKVQLVKITGAELSKTYADHNGPGNIPKEEMWKIHTDFSDRSLDLDMLMKDYGEDEVLGTVFTTGCYTEQSLPVLMYLLHKNKFNFKNSVLANANAGGDCVHRGIILGILAGAASDEIPSELKMGLVEHDSLEKEIDDFVKVTQAT